MLVIPIHRAFHNRYYAYRLGWMALLLLVVMNGSQLRPAVAQEAITHIQLEGGLLYAYSHTTKQARLADIVSVSDTSFTQPLSNATLEIVDTNRYGLPIAYLYDEGVLVQRQLVMHDHVMVMGDTLYKYTLDLLASEILPPPIAQENAARYMHHYARVEGIVKEVAVTKYATYINFGENWKKDFTIHIPKAAMKQFDDVMIASLSHKTIQVRGFIHPYYGPRITLLNPAMLEVLP